MKRHPSLEPFSRDHNTGLILARRLQQHPTEGSLNEFLHAWQVEIEDHFDEEERLLGPLISESMRAQLLDEHRLIRDVASRLKAGEPAQEDVCRLGEALENHIRWEERVLFPEIERTATSQQLAQLAKATDEVEARHAASGLAPRRAELVARRRKTL
ncbi:MAG TPA: hypothetical protein VM328_09710 [Fimbriimonadaceae bacterium]|nr:hypothetical protein [Fimbriimonadaceae bacterium]